MNTSNGLRVAALATLITLPACGITGSGLASIPVTTQSATAAERRTPESLRALPGGGAAETPTPAPAPANAVETHASPDSLRAMPGVKPVASPTPH